MAQDRPAALLDSQIVLAYPFTNKALLMAGFFHNCAISSLEKVLPADVEAVTEVAHIHQAEVFKLFTNHRVELLVHLATINDRRAATFLGRDHAEEANARGPAIHV